MDRDPNSGSGDLLFLRKKIFIHSCFKLSLILTSCLVLVTGAHVLATQRSRSLASSEYSMGVRALNQVWDRPCIYRVAVQPSSANSGMLWTTYVYTKPIACQALRQQELRHLPAVDYSLSNNRLLPELCHLLLQKSGTLAVQGHSDPPPQQATLTLGLYADGYLPRGRPNVKTEICIIAFARDWFPMFGHVPRCIDMITWMEFPKVVNGEWLRKWSEALQTPPLCKFNQHMKYGCRSPPFVVRVSAKGVRGMSLGQQAWGCHTVFAQAGASK